MEKLSMLVLSVCALSACVSSSGGNSNNGDSKFTGALREINALGVEGENIDRISVDDLPDSARMAGYLATQSENSSYLYLGYANATADFSRGTINGTANNFSEYELSDSCDSEILTDCVGDVMQNLDGSLRMNGDISGTAFTYAATGNLSGRDLQSGEAATASVDLEGIGYFGKNEGSLVALGAHGGTVQSRSSFGSEDIYGVLVLRE